MNFNLENRTILLTVAGSKSYGLNTPESDLDVKGVCVPIKPYFLSSQKFEVADGQSHLEPFKKYLHNEELALAKNGFEGSIYEIRKFIHLASECNPNIFDVLFSRDSDILLQTEQGELLRSNRDVFKTKRLKYTLQGYSASQLHRIKLHRGWLLNPILNQPERKDFGLPENPLVPKNQYEAVLSAVKKKMDSWELDLGLLDVSDRIYVQNQIENVLAEIELSIGDKFRLACRTIGIDDNFIEKLVKEREFRAAMENWHKYLEWKRNRNPKRAALEAEFGYDLKHAMHLIRLSLVCKEVLSTGIFNVFCMDADKELLMDIRAGKYSYDELIETEVKLSKEINELYLTTKLPKSPNYNKIDELCIQIVECML